jgi:pilus assembly protein CpaE
VANERVMVVDDTISVGKLVATHLEAAGYKTVIALSGQEALSKLSEGIPDLFIIDVMMPGMDGFQLTQALRADPRTASKPIVILTARDRVEDKVKGFEAGADDYVVKPFEAAELLARLRALLARAAPAAAPASAGPQGVVHAIFGLRGGAGRSTLTANLGVALAGLSNAEVVVADLAIESGHLALMLDARPVHTLDELVTRYGASFEPDVLMAYLTPSRYNVKVLAAPLTPASAPLVTVDGVRAVIETLRHRFRYTVLDLAPTFSDLNLAVLEAADYITVVMTPEMAGLKATTSAFEILDSLGYSQESIFLVVNTVFAARPLSNDDIAGALSRPVSATIPYEKLAFVDAINRGVPIVRSVPRSPSSRAILAYASDLAQRQGSRAAMAKSPLSAGK